MKIIISVYFFLFLKRIKYLSDFTFLHILSALTVWYSQHLLHWLRERLQFQTNHFFFKHSLRAFPGNSRSIPWASKDKGRHNDWAKMRRQCEGMCRLGCDGGIYAGTSSFAPFTCCTFKASSAHVRSLWIDMEQVQLPVLLRSGGAWLNGCPVENLRNQSRAM